MSWSDESLSAFLDGELPAAEMERLARDLETDAALAARLERLAAANRTFLAAAAGIDAVPLPERTQALLAGEGGAGEKNQGARVIPFPGRRISAFVMEHRAIAAGLICAAAVYGVGVATVPGPDVPASSGVILASSPLHRALEGTPTGETVQIAGGVEIRPQLTFVTGDDAYCRQYALDSGAGSVAGIACRGDDGWRLQVASFAPGRAAPGDYQSASAGRSAALEAFIEANIAGSPLNASEESAVFARGWRGR